MSFLDEAVRDQIVIGKRYKISQLQLHSKFTSEKAVTAASQSISVKKTSRGIQTNSCVML